MLESIINDHILTILSIMIYLHPTNMPLIMPGKSCVTQLLYDMELWTKSLDLGNPVDVIYFDFRSLFVVYLFALFLYTSVHPLPGLLAELFPSSVLPKVQLFSKRTYPDKSLAMALY